MIYLSLIRIHHWVKNTFIFLPLFFSGDIFNYVKFFDTFLIFIGFSLTTSFVYVFNDIRDLEYDRIHPSKKFRPIASNKVTIFNAIFISAILSLIGLTIIISINLNTFFFTLFYLIINILYSYGLKNISIFDFMIVSSGFVIRIIIGGLIGEVELSHWIVLMVFLLSLFISISKRRDDVLQLQNKNKINREVVKLYSTNFIDYALSIISSTMIVSYLMFVTSNEVFQKYDSNYLYLTFVFVLIGVLRYGQLTYVFNYNGSPIKIFFKDRFLQFVLLFWFISFFLILYY